MSNFRGKVVNFYNYELIKNNGEPELFKTRDEIKNKYGIGLSTIRNIIKGIHRKEWATSKYLEYNIKKIKIKITN